MRRSHVLRGFFLLVLTFALLPMSSTAPPQEGSLPGTRQRTVYAPYYNATRGYRTMLGLNNSTRAPFVANPRLCSLDGACVPLDTVRLEAHEFKMVDINEWVKQLGAGFAIGSVRVDYESVGFGLGAQLSIVNEKESISLDVPLRSRGEFRSPRLEGIWWAPGKDTRLTLAVLNTTDQTLKASLILTGREGRELRGTPLPLAPQQTRVLNLRQLAARMEEVGGITILYEGPQGAVIAQGFALNPETGFSTNLPMEDPATATNTLVAGAGVYLGVMEESGGLRFRGNLLLRNTSSEVLTAKPSLQQGGSQVDLGEVKIGAGESRAIVVEPETLALTSDPIGIQVAHSGPLGALVAQWHSVDASGSLVVETPLRWPRKLPSGGNNPWSLDSTTSSVMYVHNTGTEEAAFVAMVWHQAGFYMIGRKEIPAGGTFSLDIRQLRDAQVPDLNGAMLPADLSSGQIQWRWRSGPPLVGRVVVMNRSKAMATNMSCAACCCERTNVWLELVPSSVNAETGEVVSEQLVENYEGCDIYGNALFFSGSPDTNFVDWDSSNWNVAAPNGSGRTAPVFCGLPGNATISAGTWLTYDRPCVELEGCSPFIEDCSCSPVQDFFMAFADYYVDAPPQAVPVNFRQTSVVDVGNGILRFTYAWDSSSGNLNDLSNCTVSERVVYPGQSGQPYCWIAPFPVICTENPTIVSVPGSDATVTDDHGLSGKTGSDFRKPYFGASFTAQQTVTYSCASGSVTGTLLGPIPIERSVSESTNNKWKYTVTKPTNGLAKIDPLPD